MSEYDYTFKLILFGDGAVGKTSLAQRYLKGVFNEKINVTIGVEFYVKFVQYGERRVKLQIWDIGGEERFRFMLPEYCKGANGGIFLYDTTAPATLQHLPDWWRVIVTNAPNIPVLMVGAKVDLVEKRKVTREEAMQVAKTLRMAGFVEASAKSGYNVEAAFETITKIMIRKEGFK